jgi:hypothetical protein
MVSSTAVVLLLDPQIQVKLGETIAKATFFGIDTEKPNRRTF